MHKRDPQARALDAQVHAALLEVLAQAQAEGEPPVTAALIESRLPDSLRFGARLTAQRLLELIQRGEVVGITPHHHQSARLYRLPQRQERPERRIITLTAGPLGRITHSCDDPAAGHAFLAAMAEGIAQYRSKRA